MDARSTFPGPRPGYGQQGPEGVTDTAIPPASGSAMPSLVFTVAITGQQDIPRAQHEKLTKLVSGVLGAAHRELVVNQQESAIDRNRPLCLRFVSALAPGADQIGARAALAHDREKEGWQLEALLPFAVPVFQQKAREALEKRNAEKDNEDLKLAPGEIEEALAAIPDLASRARRTLELADWQPSDRDPEHSDWSDRRFATIGQMLVRRCDLLIAIWDGLPPRGRGGTADVVTEARRSGVPVVWIDPQAPDELQSLIPGAASASVPASDLVIRWRAALANQRKDPYVSPKADEAISRAVEQVLLGHDKARSICIARYLDEDPTWKWTTKAASSESSGEEAPGDTFWSYPFMLYLFLRLPPRAMQAQASADVAAREPAKPLRSWPWKPVRRAGTRFWWRKVLLYPFGFGVERGEAGTANAAPLLDHAELADALATRLSNQYRSAYVKIFALAPLAVTWAVLSLLCQDYKPIFVICELFTVGWAARIYLRSRDRDPVALDKLPDSWRKRYRAVSLDTHQRWLDARLIAESQRSGQLLAWVGFSGRRPIEEQARAEDAERPEDHPKDHAVHHAKAHGHAPRTVWAPHFANAIAALPELPHDGEGSAQVTSMSPVRIAQLAAAARQVIDHQRGYHDLNHQRLEQLNHRLDTFSLVMIGIAFAFSAAFLLTWLINLPGPLYRLPMPAGKGSWQYALYSGLKPVAAFGGAVLPAIAAAAAGIRFQGDFGRFAMRSKDTAERLAVLAERAERIATDAGVCGADACAGRPPLFEQLLDLLLDTQAVLDEDLADWRFAYAARPITLG